MTVTKRLGILVLATLPLSAHATCPDLTPSALTAWRADRITELTTGSAYSVRHEINQCFPGGTPACLSRLAGEPPAYEYSIPQLDDPTTTREMREPPEEFRVPGDTDAFFPPANLEALAKARGWKSVKFKTRGSGGFDSSTSTLYIFEIPGSTFTPPRNFDQYIQFSLPERDPTDTRNPVPSGTIPVAADYASNPGLPQNFSMITMEKASGGRLARPYFQLFTRRDEGPSFYRNPTGESACYGCHANGLRAIGPRGYHVQTGETELPEATRLAVTNINADMESYGPIEWRTIRPANIGPVLGPNSAASKVRRTEAFILGTPDAPGCAFTRREITVSDAMFRPYLDRTYTMSSPPNIRADRVRKAMNCAGCHNGSFRGQLTEGTDTTMIWSKLLDDRSMPPGHSDLNTDERIALGNCLLAERALERPAWYAEVPCILGTATTVAPGPVASPGPAAVTERQPPRETPPTPGPVVATPAPVVTPAH